MTSDPGHDPPPTTETGAPSGLGDGMPIALGAAADLITYPSLYEGFGNAFLEGVYHRTPIVVNRYPIYELDIRPKGFRCLEMDGYITELTTADRIPTHSPPYNMVDEYDTFDFHYAIRIPSWHTTFRLSVVNATDEDPPVMWDELAYDAFTHNPLGRMVKLGVQYQF